MTNLGLIVLTIMRGIIFFAPKREVKTLGVKLPKIVTFWTGKKDPRNRFNF